MTRDQARIALIEDLRKSEDLNHDLAEQVWIKKYESIFTKVYASYKPLDTIKFGMSLYFNDRRRAHEINIKD